MVWMRAKENKNTSLHCAQLCIHRLKSVQTMEGSLTTGTPNYYDWDMCKGFWNLILKESLQWMEGNKSGFWSETRLWLKPCQQFATTYQRYDVDHFLSVRPSTYCRRPPKDQFQSRNLWWLRSESDHETPWFHDLDPIVTINNCFYYMWFWREVQWSHCQTFRSKGWGEHSLKQNLYV